MSKNANRGNITSFFTQGTQVASQKVPSSPGPPPSLPSTPIKPKPHTQATVVAASDDEDSGASTSDESLADLSTILGTRRPSEAAPVRNQGLAASNKATETPRAKRTALIHPSSPLTLNPKVHKFDFKALANAARLDDAISAKSARADAVAKSVARRVAAASAEEAQKTTNHDSSDEDGEDRALVGVVTDNAGDDAHKVLRAVRRAEPGGTHTRYCFFGTAHTVPESQAPPKIQGPWRILTQGTLPEREQHIMSGLPQTMMEMDIEITNQLFDWMLDEVCIQTSSICRSEYCNLLAQCPPLLIEERITPRRLEQLFLRLGASRELQIKDAELPLSKHIEEPYSGQEWACLSSFMRLIGSVATSLSLASTRYAAQAFLRLSLDPVVLQAPGLLVDYQEAVISVLDAIPFSIWDSFCFETSSMLQALVRASSIRINLLLCLPLHDTQAHDLRRRFAIAFLFDDPNLARGHPSKAVSMRDLINRLHGSDFTIRAKTDFLTLQSNILLLDAAIDDGSFSSAATDAEIMRTSAEAEAAFNEEVDELADRLRAIWRKINDSGLKLARTEAKGVLEWVQQRLAHLVRTRKKMRQSIFDMDIGRDRPGVARSQMVNDLSLPRQQDYMRRFLQKPKVLNENDGVDEDRVA